MGLSRAMLTKAVSRFVDEGLVAEDREDRLPSGRGQPAIRLRLRPKARLGIGINLWSQGLNLAISNLAYQIVATDSHAPPDRRCPNDAGAYVVDKTRQLLACHGASLGPIAGIALTLPGLMKSSHEIQEITPSQRHVPYEAVRAALAETFGTPVYFENQGPAYYESIQPTNDAGVLLYVSLDYGVGGGLVDHHRIFRGGFNQAVNIGALIPETGPRPNVTDFARTLGRREISEAELQEMVATDDARLREWIDVRAPLLSHPLSTAVQLLNPEVIVLGGQFPRQVYQAIIEKIDLSLCDVPGRVPLTKPQMRVASLTGGHAMASAVAAIPIARAFGY